MGNYTRVYTQAGVTAHLLDELLSPNSPNSALCGRAPNWPDLWHGTGSQVEEERAAVLPLCVRCSTLRDERGKGVIIR